MLTVLHGDCRELLKTLPDESVQCCVTSPPYWGHRDYGVDSQIGLEKTPDEYVATMVQVFREVRRALRSDGTLWLNLGDSYASAWACNRRSQLGAGAPNIEERMDRSGVGLKEKDLVGIPWMVAFALRADGWYLRQDIIWHKPSCMPESVKDRCTNNHEHIFLLSKSPKYYFDHIAIQEPCSESFMNDSRWETGPTGENEKIGYAEAGAQNPKSVHRIFKRSSAKRGDFNGKTQALPGREAFRAFREMRNKRSVWTVATAPFKEAHFATFPPKLIQPCILAGTKVGDTVLDPFGGSGTTGQVAIERGRKAILIELNSKYLPMIENRTMVVGLPL